MKKIPVRHINSNHKEQTSSNSFTIRKVQDLINGKNLYQELHRHDFFFVLALQSGTGTHEIDFINYPVSNNCIFFLRPGQVHQLELKVGCTGYLMEFNTGFYHPYNKLSNQRFRKAGNKNMCLIDRDRFEKLQAVLSYIYQEYTEKQESYLEIIKANLEIFLIEFIRKSASQNSSSTTINPYQQDRFEEFSALLDLYITVNKKVSQYADLMNLSIYQLNEITKATLGKTASQLINEHIILEAKRYLLATSNQIKEIADFLGYEDVSYFIRLFKKHTGYSPETFRRNNG